MIIAVPKETFPGENRVALVPLILPILTKAGLEVMIQSGAGEAAGFTDPMYVDKGATIVQSRDDLFAKGDVILQVRVAGANPEAGKADLPRYRSGQVIIAHCDPLSNPQASAEVAARGVALFALELLPRITRRRAWTCFRRKPLWRAIGPCSWPPPRWPK